MVPGAAQASHRGVNVTAPMTAAIRNNLAPAPGNRETRSQQERKHHVAKKPEVYPRDIHRWKYEYRYDEQQKKDR